jgi:hypothetical protein
LAGIVVSADERVVTVGLVEGGVADIAFFLQDPNYG